jgi:hypothetical protein
VITRRTYARDTGGITERLVMTTVALPSASVRTLTRPVAALLEADGYAEEESRA